MKRPDCSTFEKSRNTTERNKKPLVDCARVHKIVDGTIGSRHHQRLRANESYDELLLLGRCDRGGRVPGIETRSLEDAIDILRELGTS